MQLTAEKFSSKALNTVQSIRTRMVGTWHLQNNYN